MYKKILFSMCFGIVATNNCMHIFKQSALLLVTRPSINSSVLSNKRCFSTRSRDKRISAMYERNVEKQNNIIQEIIEKLNQDHQKSLAKELKILKNLMLEQQLQILELKMKLLGADENWQFRFDTQEITRLHIEKQKIQQQIIELNKR